MRVNSLNFKYTAIKLSRSFIRKAYVALFWVITATLFNLCQANEALTQDHDIAVADTLKQASSYEDLGNNESAWKAASLYCNASRLGNTEAQYRLGMLYAFGKGVPPNRAYAATLFSIAGRQGHNEAAKMLETINFVSETVPPCVEQDTPPEKKSYSIMATLNANSDETAGIDRYIINLPKQQKWAIDLVNATAEWNDVDPKLVIAIIAIESGFNEHALSNANAMGMMQLIPATAEKFNVKNAFNAAQNIKGGVRYLKWLLNYYAGDVEFAVAAYNAGEKAVDRYRGVPPYKETIEYVRRFKLLYKSKLHAYTEKSELSPIKAGLLSY